MTDSILCKHESHENAIKIIATSCHIESYHKLQTQTQNVNMNPKYEPSKMNTTTARHSQANKTSRHIVTCHLRHIFMPVDQTIKKFISHNNLLNVTIQSHPIKRDCCNTNKKCLVVATINPIWCSHPVHHGTKF